MLLEDAAQHHGSHREGGFTGHAHQPLQPVTAHPVRADHVPRVNQDGEIKCNTRFPERIKLDVIQFSTARLGADLNANKADLGNAAELLNGHLWFLQGHGAEGQKMIGVAILHFRKVIIQELVKVQRFRGWSKVGKKNRDGRDHLDIDTVSIIERSTTVERNSIRAQPFGTRVRLVAWSLDHQRWCPEKSNRSDRSALSCPEVLQEVSGRARRSADSLLTLPDNLDFGFKFNARNGLGRHDPGPALAG